MATINERLNELVALAPRVEISSVVLRLLKNGTLFYGDVRRSAHAANRTLDIIDELLVERAYQENAKGYAAGKAVATTQLWNKVRAFLFDACPRPADATSVLLLLAPLFVDRAADNSIPPEQPRKAELVIIRERDEARAKVTQLLLREQTLFTENAQLRTEMHVLDAAVRRQEHITAEQVVRLEDCERVRDQYIEANTRCGSLINAARAVTQANMRGQAVLALNQLRSALDAL